jgi:phage/plasmid-associated DNA primase
VTTLEHIIGKFNSHLRYAYLIHANEAIWGGNKKEVGAIKALITDPTIIIEGKGKDAIPVDNCRHLIVSSNEDWAVPMDLDDRRFFVLDVSSHRKEDRHYFQALDKQMLQEGGVEALLYDLLHEDLSDFDPRKMPPNDFGFDMKMKAATSVVKFLYEALKEGRFNMAMAAKTGAWEPHSCEQIYYLYKEWCKGEGLRQESNAEFGRQLKKLLPVIKRRRVIDGGREWWYEFPALEECRVAFEKFTKQSRQIWEE